MLTSDVLPLGPNPNVLGTWLGRLVYFADLDARVSYLS
jgi:hypothetical protein